MVYPTADNCRINHTPVCVWLLVQYSPAAIHPAGATEVDQNNCAGERPGAHIGQAEHRQRVEDLEDRHDPQDAEGADAEANDDYRADCIARTAQNGREDLVQCPGEVKGNKVQDHLPGG